MYQQKNYYYYSHFNQIMKFFKNQVVWAKAKGSPQWPAQIKKVCKQYYVVSFYNENTQADICEDDLCDFETHKQNYGKGASTKLMKAIAMAQKQNQKQKSSNPKKSVIKEEQVRTINHQIYGQVKKKIKKQPITINHQIKQQQIEMNIDIGSDAFTTEINVQFNSKGKQLQWCLMKIIEKIQQKNEDKQSDIKSAISNAIKFHQNHSFKIEDYFFCKIGNYFNLILNKIQSVNSYKEEEYQIIQEIQKIKKVIENKLFSTSVCNQYEKLNQKIIRVQQCLNEDEQ